MKSMKSTLLWLVLASLLVFVAGWTKEDHEIFRLRDEVELSEGEGVTFYDFLGVKPSASHEQILKAHRKKSALHHPDKAERNFVAKRHAEEAKSGQKKGKAQANKKPTKRELQRAVKEAQEKYSRLAVVKEILTGEDRRRYDHFLKNGFPQWRSTGYYYQRFRPGLAMTLFGLWLFVGGFAHYGILILGYNQQRDFVEKTIRKARMAAYGDESSAAAIPGIDTIGQTVSASAAEPEEPEEPTPEPRNRKERRMMEKMERKETKTKTPSQKKTNTRPAVEESVVPKRRVLAENGKVLLVANDGHVFLEEEDDDGNTEELLLDPDSIEKPSFSQTALFRAPVWAFQLVRSKLSGSIDEETSESIKANSPETAAREIKEAVENAANGVTQGSKKQKKRG